MVKGSGFLPTGRHAHPFQGQTPVRIYQVAKVLHHEHRRLYFLSLRNIVSYAKKTEKEHSNLSSPAYFIALTQIVKALRNACPDSRAEHYTIFLPGLYPVCSIRIQDYLQSHRILKLFFEALLTLF